MWRFLGLTAPWNCSLVLSRQRPPSDCMCGCCLSCVSSNNPMWPLCASDAYRNITVNGGRVYQYRDTLLYLPYSQADSGMTMSAVRFTASEPTCVKVSLYEVRGWLRPLKARH
ncbi:uncharacterized protein C8Q71DRAFT_148420 [Rhodofomes roseus]|uniref:Secreted protein n=1 Tax=Rhodofomes roseus TaxID=34475 RepID=A0ABQ8KAU3_9APHY|nr:uncharacterized protein C8Q71DRAFT_148420 [Rhodofomes roseus]KAH9834590.1 hypothetical protein C8Q71DRAFT_148420 [Rhodofomes roseus]